MEFAKAQKYIARVSDKYFINENNTFLLIKLELINPDRIYYSAGQYVSIKVNEKGERRSYSIASTPDVNHGLTMIAEIIPGGKGSEYLKTLNPGDNVEVLGPLGRFVIETEKEKKLFVATGSGIAPIYAMINDLLINKKVTAPIRLHWGMRNEGQIFWFDNFERLAEEYPNFVFDPVLSRSSENWGLCTGHVQDCIKRDLSAESLDKWESYICGNPNMVEEVSALLMELGMPESQVHSEKFA